ncbi:type II toxin-antitoxin system HigA family antitoxin [Pseudomonas sp. HS6]|uniref:helix-turn-helix domain-containing protein n=1 Tax=Pseudomonas sp. HS6 TaxID=2850559 RepID=UPI002018F1BF|nr:transcriptional regulator [Pseudomonas sp. HS6]
MSVLIKKAAEHWEFVSPLLRKPKNESDYDLLVQALDELLGMTGDDESHPLMSLVDIIGDWIEEWDRIHHPVFKSPGFEVLGYLMREHGLTQSDLPGVGTQSVVSEILSGKRQLNLRQVRWLADHFDLPMEVFAPTHEEQLISRCLPHSGGRSA